MKVIIPNELSLLSSSIAETDAGDGPIWNADTTYNVNARVRHNHVTYASLQDGNKGNNPETSWSGVLASWKRVSATAPYRMIDSYVETQTIAPTGQTLSFCLPYNRADSFALLNMSGNSVNIKIYDYDEPAENQLVYTVTVNLLEDIHHLSLYEYNYYPLVTLSNFSEADLPLVYNGRICVDILANSGHTAAIGMALVGKRHELGLTNYGAELGFTDYSRKSTDEFGVTTLVRRSFASRASLPVYLHPDQQDYVYQVLTSVRGLPCLWLGDNDMGKSSLITYGWLEDFRLTCEGPSEDQLSLEIQGLI